MESANSFFGEPLFISEKGSCFGFLMFQAGKEAEKLWFADFTGENIDEKPFYAQRVPICVFFGSVKLRNSF